MKKRVVAVLVLLMMFSQVACSAEKESQEQVLTSEQNNVTESADSELISKAPDGFPEKEITIVVAADAGTEEDMITREFVNYAEKYTGAKFIVDNRGGSSGVDGLTALINAEADGYTVLTSSTTLAIQLGAGQTPYTIDDIYPLAGVHGSADNIIVKGDSPYQTLQDLIDDAKANPGKINWGAAKTISVHHIFTMMVSKDADISVNYVAYDKAADAKVGVLNGDVQVGSITYGQIKDEVESGDIRILATSSAERNPAYPDVPTLAECGLMTANDYSVYRGYFLKPGVEQSHIDWLNEVILRVQNDPEWQEYITDVVDKDNLYMDTPTFTEWFVNIAEFVEGII